MPKTKEQNEQIKEERREQLLLVALRVFCTFGFDATKIADIATSAGISHGLVYHYYKTKDDIFITLLQIAPSIYEQMYAMLTLEDGLDEKQKLDLLIADTLQRLSDGENYCMTMYFALNIQLIKRGFEKTMYDKKRELTCAAKAQHRKSRLEVHGKLLELFTKGIEKGLFLDVEPTELEAAFWSVINGITMKKMKAVIRKKEFKVPSAQIIRRLFVRDVN